MYRKAAPKPTLRIATAPDCRTQRPGSVDPRQHRIPAGGCNFSQMFKTTDAQTPAEYIDMLEEPRKSDIRELDALIRRNAPNLEPHIASGMLAYGHYHYKGKTTEGEWFHIGLASNKRYISLYVMAGDKETGGYLAESFKDRLPKADIGRSCVRIKRLSDVDRKALEELIKKGATFEPVALA
jgi:hypothetical protein